ncbi:MAG: 3-deoxy-7-phosphoheptulonate synthase, partial [bacterium]|nr:3-deoxy-7-phosphoheptulonate synthase [bacterium]
MIIVIKKDATDDQIEHVVEKIKDAGLAVHISKGSERTIIGAIGDEALMASVPIEALPGVEKAMPILKPYKLVSREFQNEDTIIDVNGVKIGGDKIQIIAGPCSVEGRDILVETAKLVKGAGATLLRGGAFKPRTSPDDFQGLGEEALKYLSEASEETGLAVVSEL